MRCARSSGDSTASGITKVDAQLESTTGLDARTGVDAVGSAVNAGDECSNSDEDDGGVDGTCAGGGDAVSNTNK